MSGHSKWSKIKRSKGVADAKKGQMFTKLGREIAVAVREGGPDPESNFRLRLAIQKCRENNMPMDNVNSAIKRASGAGGSGAALIETTFEGYGPGGAAILIQALTDNRNRTLQEIRNAFSRGGGSLAEAGSVAWLFESKGTITVDTGSANPEDVALVAIDAGAEDVSIENGYIEVYTAPNKLEAVRRALEQAKYSVSSAEISMIPKTTLQLGEEEALKALRLMDRIEELDDVQRVFSNVDFSDAVMEKLRAGA
ncbi:MAG: YebC/PmpR family DNA-binding transcriptional regulator [Dehalococcoidia bacterium]|nr:YebC/PmpR family DNA-binding transcriptional regulator [Dehalococcoidia bacterium]